MTMHNGAQKGEIAERIVLVGDPNRAKMIAEKYLENPVLVNDIRCAYCYTGMFEGGKGFGYGGWHGLCFNAYLRHRAMP